jgi:hypothetical protein
MDNHGSIPRPRPKALSIKLRSEGPRSTVVLPASGMPKHSLNCARTDISVPRTTTNGPTFELESSMHGRKTGLPTRVERTIPPIARPQAGPPTKEYRAFSFGTAKTGAASVSSLGDSSDKSPSGERKPKRIIRKKSSTSSTDRDYLSRERKTSAVSFNNSTTSLSTASFSSRDALQTSVLGIAAPSTSTNYPYQSATMMRQRSDSSSNIPRILTQDATVYDSSPSTRHTDSPFSHSSTPTSASSHSPGPAAMLRTVSSSPSRPPVTRQRKGSLVSVDSGNEVGLDPVRESTTSTSSDSTVHALEYIPKSDHSDSPVPQTNSPSSKTPIASPFKPPKLAPSPQLVSRSVSSARSASLPRRKPSVSGIPARPKEVTGLGLSIPNIAVSSLSIPKTRSRSISSTFSQQRAPLKDVISSPLPPPGPPPPAFHKRLSGGFAQGLSYSNIRPANRKGSMDSALTSPLGLKLPPPGTKPGFFSRGRAKSEEKPPEKQLTKRGPTAGTGYEGYGAFGKASRGRSGSVSGTIRARSGSQTSNRSRSGSRSASRDSVEMDDYFMDRLKPVVIVGGGGVIENQNRSVEMVRSRSSPEVMVSDYNHNNKPANYLEAGAFNGVFSRGSSPGSDSSKETVARRRANLMGKTVMPTIPAPINTTGHRIPPSPSPAGSLTASVSSSGNQSLDPQDLGTPASSKPKSKRWNFFQKSQPKTPLSVPPSQDNPTLAAPQVPKSSTFRRHFPAHYAILDYDEQREAQKLVDHMHVMRQRHVESGGTPTGYTHVLRKQQNVHFTEKLSEVTKKKSQTPILSAEQFIQEDAERAREKVRFDKSEERKVMQQQLQPIAAASTKPRLPQIQTHSLDRRPSVNHDPRSAPARMGRVISHMFDGRSQQEFQINWDFAGLTPTNATSGEEKYKSFLEYDPLDIRGRRANPLTDTEKDSYGSQNPQKILEEEEYWEEYNELAGLYGFQSQPASSASIIKRSSTVKSTTSSLGSPFQYADLCSPLECNFESPLEEADPVDREVGDVSVDEEESDGEGDEEEQEAIICTPDSPTLPKLPPPKPIPHKIPIITRTASLILGDPEESLPFTPPAQGLLSPATPFSITSFLRYYGETEGTGPLNNQIDSISSAGSSRKRRSSGSSITTINTQSSAGSLPSLTVEDEMNIRPWALIASRWLSFDRVLVSPAHQTLQNGSGSRVLVVDGLGTG